MHFLICSQKHCGERPNIFVAGNAAFIGIVMKMDLDSGPPPKSIDFMLHGGFLSAGWCIFNRYHMIARKGQLLLTHRSGHYWLALGRH